MEPIALVIALAFGGVLAWYFLQPRPLFVIHVFGDEKVRTKGRVSDEFLTEVKSVCQDCGVKNGVIKGIRRGKRVSLAFSHGIPRNCQQRLRNIWNLPK